MSKRITAVIFFLLGILIGSGICLFAYERISHQEGIFVSANESESHTLSSNSDQFVLTSLAMNVVDYLKNNDYDSLASIVHPGYNLVFSPYATINLNTAKYFTAEEVKALDSDKTIYTWGTFDGTSDAIEMTFKEYYDKFIFDKDYSLAPIISPNNIVASGNALENIKEVFSEAEFVEFHYPNSENADSDWSTLRLVFEKYDDTYALTAIVHSSLTV